MVEAYGDGGFRISGITWRGPVIVFPHRSVAWPEANLETLSTEMLAPVLAVDDVPEILLLGCGPTTVLVPAQLRSEIRARGPVIDAMDTGAACRTYNILMTEGRRVAAALLPIG